MKIQFNKLKALIQNNKLLRITFLAGGIFLVLTIGALVLFILMGRSSTREARQLETFSRALREYDLLVSEITGTEREYERLNRELERLERRAISVESWLSILKRRRTLARLHLPSTENYTDSIKKALEIYPSAQQITAIAAEALIKGTAINRETEEELKGFLPSFTGGSFNTIRLALHVLLGDFNSPHRAAVIPVEVFSDGTQAITMDIAILKVVRGDIHGAGGDVQMMLQSAYPSNDFFRLAAEYYYDFGDINRSAELFSFIDDEKAMIRQADALYLAGYTESARAIWTLLSDSQPPVERSLYNLALTSYESDEAVSWFERLVNLETTEITDIRQYGLIHYSRLLDVYEAVSLLESIDNLSPSANPFIDLEIIRRQSQLWELGRQIAEAWLLLDRHDSNEDLYFWTAWLFLFQRNYSEIQILLNRMEINNFSQRWVKLFRGIDLMFEGELDTSEEILRSIPPDEITWAVYANLGCILEAQRSTSRALEQYKLATENTTNPRTASRLQVRIARCYTTLNYPVEARRALELALELDPANLTAKLELDRTVFSY